MQGNEVHDNFFVMFFNILPEQEVGKIPADVRYIVLGEPVSPTPTSVPYKELCIFMEYHTHEVANTYRNKYSK